MYKNEQKVQFTVINVQGNHVHLKEQLTSFGNLQKVFLRLNSTGDVQ